MIGESVRHEIDYERTDVKHECHRCESTLAEEWPFPCAGAKTPEPAIETPDCAATTPEFAVEMPESEGETVVTGYQTLWRGRTPA